MADRERANLNDPEDKDSTFLPDADQYATRISSEESDTVRTEFPARDPFATFVPAKRRRTSDREVRYDALVRGDQIGDFRIQRLLGRGSFGAVYLARDLTLDRLVAIKVVMPEGKHATAGEGRSLARLKHTNIVGVYGEAHDDDSGCCLLWMQYVDGSNLATLIQRLYQDSDSEWNESDLLGLMVGEDQPNDQEPTSRVSRGKLETVCRIGQQLSEALNHAHRGGITHRDIKPANILMQRDGTPLLADFNLADNAHDDRERMTGGTIAYMPPEQLAQCLGQQVSCDDRRADIYSLGVVLWELAFGSRPYQSVESKIESSGTSHLHEFLQLRQEEPPPADEDVPIGLELVLRRAVCAEVEKRYPSASAMATALSGLSELQRARRNAPSADRVRDFVRRNLFWILLIGGLLPNIAASIFQSYYNLVWIIRPSGEEFKESFGRAFIAYNVVVYPACVGWLAWNLYKFAQGYRRVLARRVFPRGQLRKLRGRLLRLPRQFMIASAVGWFPGIVLFPWLLGVFGQPPSASQWFHLAISFMIAGLIATTYSYAIVLYVAVCHGYRACWQTATRYRQRAREELAGMERRIRVISILVGVLPLAAAVMLLAVGMPSLEQMTPRVTAQVRSSHRLLIALIVSGAIGLYLVQTASARLIRCVRALTLADD